MNRYGAMYKMNHHIVKAVAAWNHEKECWEVICTDRIGQDQVVFTDVKTRERAQFCAKGLMENNAAAITPSKGGIPK